ncbi:MAG: DoxX family protein [Planctomycetota bacterium]
MSKQVIAYWAVTGLFCLAMTASGTMNLMGVEPMKEAITSLGYPEYLMKILGVAKLLGVFALLCPGLPLLKEWAYAGFTFDLIGASASHAFSEHAFAEVITPLVVLAIAAASYFLRPVSRRISATITPNLDSSREAVQ